MLDVAIVGGGPAGLTAGIYAARAGMNTTLFESLTVGGQLTSIDDLENYPGFPQGINGFEIAMALRSQAERFGVHIVQEAVIKLEGNASSGFSVITASESYDTRTVIIATGAKPRKIDDPALLHLEGRGVSYCATCDGNFFRDKDVVIVGGGDTACADAIYLSNICNSVHIVHRRDELRAHRVYVDRVMRKDNIHIHWHHVYAGFGETNDMLSRVIIRNVITDEETVIPASALFVAIGTEPKTEWLNGFVACDEHGYIIAESDCATSVSGVYAAGDIRTTLLRQVVTAAADGALAAEAAVNFVAS